MSSQDVSRCNCGSISPVFAADLLYGFGSEKTLPLWLLAGRSAVLFSAGAVSYSHHLAHQDGPQLPSGSLQDFTEGMGCTLVSISLKMAKPQ